MFAIGFINQQSKYNMSFNQDITRYKAKHLRAHHSPRRMLSLPSEGATHRFKSKKTGSNVSLNSACSSKDDCSSGDNSEPNEGEEAGSFVRDQSLQSSFSSNLSSLENFSNTSQAGSDSPVLAHGPPFDPPLAFEASSSALEAHDNNNIVELVEFNEHFASRRLSHKKKKKKVAKKSKSSSSSLASDGSSTLTVIPNAAGLESCKDESSFFSFMMPSYKSRLSTYLTTFIDIPTTEKLVDDFMCALHRDILLQGRLYISQNYIAFYSNILGFETKVTVPFTEVKHITKATTIKLFHNAIEVYTFGGEKYFFTSFVSRERAYKEMKLLWESASGIEGNKLGWAEVCRLIRQSYSTQNLGANLDDLEEADLEKHLSKTKTVRKRLQKKKDQLQSMNNSSSETIDSAKSLNDDEDREDDELYEDTVDGGVLEDAVEGDKPWTSRLHNAWLLAIEPIRRACHDIQTGLSHEKTLVRLCYLLAIFLLLFQLILLYWINSFDGRLEVYRDLIAQALQQRSQLHGSRLPLAERQSEQSAAFPIDPPSLTTPG